MDEKKRWLRLYCNPGVVGARHDDRVQVTAKEMGFDSWAAADAEPMKLEEAIREHAEGWASNFLDWGGYLEGGEDE